MAIKKTVSTACPISAIDRATALRLIESIDARNRLDFARTFIAAVTEEYLRSEFCNPPSLPSGMSTAPSPLSPTAREAASRCAAALERGAPAMTAHVLGSLYTALLPDAFRAGQGIFYTPPHLVNSLLNMAEEAGVDWVTTRVLDPACGGGAFLVGVAARMASALASVEPAIALQSIAARLRGFDLDPFGAWLAQAMIVLALSPIARAARREVLNLAEMRDSLDLLPGEMGLFDLVVGNPPYGRVALSQDRRDAYRRSVYGHANLYGVFTDAALHWLKPGGVVAYVTPTSMLSGLYYKALRELLASEATPLAISFVTDRDGVFADVLQETMLTTYRKGGVVCRPVVGTLDNRGVAHPVGTFALPAVASVPWILPRSKPQVRLARRLRSMPHRLSDYGYGVSTGPLVWNRHKGQLARDKAHDTDFPIIWAEAVTSEGQFIWRSAKKNHLPWLRARRPKDDWLIVTRACVLLQRTTAKEQARRLIAAELPEEFIRKHGGVVVENHLNMIRAIHQSPSVSVATIASILNSDVVDAAFRCINGSVAVSAFELSHLPLPAPPVLAKIDRLVKAGAAPSKIEGAVGAAYGWNDAAAAA